jgi:hypothetical protein
MPKPSTEAMHHHVPTITEDFLPLNFRNHQCCWEKAVGDEVGGDGEMGERERGALVTYHLFPSLDNDVNEGASKQSMGQS